MHYYSKVTSSLALHARYIDNGLGRSRKDNKHVYCTVKSRVVDPDPDPVGYGMFCPDPDPELLFRIRNYYSGSGSDPGEEEGRKF